LRLESLKLNAIRITIGAYRNTKVATSQARNQTLRLYSSGPARSRAMRVDPLSKPDRGSAS
jgi:hypothetical protein